MCVDVSPDGRALAAVGQDEAGRQTIVIWDISPLREGKKVRGAAWGRQTSKSACVRGLLLVMAHLALTHLSQLAACLVHHLPARPHRPHA